MKKITITAWMMLLFSILLIGCGGGKGGDESNPPTPAAQPTTAVVKVFTSGALAAGAQIGGVDVTVDLPVGVTVKATVDSVNAAVYVTNTGVVSASGVSGGTNAQTLATYSAATAAAPGMVIVHLANPNGFGIGEFVTVNCDIAAGNNPSATSFAVTNLNVTDLSGASLSSLTAGYTATIQ